MYAPQGAMLTGKYGPCIRGGVQAPATPMFLINETGQCYFFTLSANAGGGPVTTALVVFAAGLLFSGSPTAKSHR